jgi:hypothetical protein
MTLRSLLLLLVAVLGVGAMASAASAKTRDSRAAVLKDCRHNDNWLTKAHTTANLKAARKARGGAACADAISTQLAELGGRRGKGTVKAVIADCSNHGRLTRSYSATILRRAAEGLPGDVAQYTTCPQAIRSARAVAAHRKPRY